MIDFAIDGKLVYVAATGLKVGSRGKVEAAGKVFGRLDKGLARRLRKQLRAAGHPAKAATPRI